MVKNRMQNGHTQASEKIKMFFAVSTWNELDNHFKIPTGFSQATILVYVSCVKMMGARTCRETMEAEDNSQ